eukprot:g2224.t1
MMLHAVGRRAVCSRLLGRVCAASSKTWIPQSEEELSNLVQAAVGAQLDDHNQKAADEIVPWFFNHMPTAYFNTVPESLRMLHMRALCALHDSGIPPELTIRDPRNNGLTFIQPAPGGDMEAAERALGSSFSDPGGSFREPGSVGDKPGERESSTNVLVKNLLELPGRNTVGMLTGVNLFTSTDNSLMLNTFDFGRQDRFAGFSDKESAARQKLLDYVATLGREGQTTHGTRSGKKMPQLAPYFEEEALDAYLRNCSSDYVCRSNTRRFLLQRELYEQVRGTEGVALQVEDGWTSEVATPGRASGSQLHMITIAAANVQPRAHLIKLGQFVGLFDIDIQRTHLDVVADGFDSHITMIRLLCEAPTGMADGRWQALERGIKRLKWLDEDALDLVLNHKVDEDGSLDLAHAEVITALCSMLHGVLAKKNQYAYARARIFEMARDDRVLPTACAIASLFLDKFDPAKGRMPEAEFAAREAALMEEIQLNVESDDHKMLLQTMLSAVRSTLKTNAFIPDRFALALRLDPAILGVNEVIGDDIPFGSLFVHGRRFNGFHCRFRDISRGGLRVVLPQSREQHAMESARQYDEVYSLSFAQQLKNKDIPEGGSKAVVLVDCPAESGREEQFESDEEFRHYVVRKSVKAFSDAMLDMLSTHDHIRDAIVDYYGRPELIYLGPDENIIPQDINWMIANAHKRGYPIPNAFMSSKPDAGINHKEFGVTSEGVAVFADVALEANGFKPREPGNPFTVKITGGPDGDVAGNIINILWREYGENVCIVGIADGTGCAEDPAGLDMQELLRLFKAERPICDFDPSKLGESGVLNGVDTPEGARARNSMHNRVVADVFVPAGGRPATINELNCSDFLLEDGTPSSKLIVEGANLFVTPPARQWLFDNGGVIIVKDSSANKCGVITSSFEIMASMMLEPEEFLKDKAAIVDDTLERLRSLARVEAELLFREFERDPHTALPPTSQRISQCITRVHDAISLALESLQAEQRDSLQCLVEEHLPAALLEASRDRISERVPRAYVDEVIASALASKIVYKEGLDFIEALPDSSLSAVAFAYLDSEKRVMALVEEVQASDIANKDMDAVRAAVAKAFVALHRRLAGDELLAGARPLLSRLCGLLQRAAEAEDAGAAGHEAVRCFSRLETQLRCAQCAYVEYAACADDQVLAAQLLLCVSTHGPLWRVAHMARMREDEAHLRRACSAPALCAAAVGWAWAARCQLIAKRALAARKMPKAASALASTQTAFRWAASRAARLSAAAVAANAAKTAAEIAAHAQSMPAHAAAMEKRIKSGIGARDRLVKRSGGGWHRARRRFAPDSVSGLTSTVAPATAAEPAAAATSRTDAHCSAFLHELLSTAPFRFIGGLYLGVVLDSAGMANSSGSTSDDAAALHHMALRDGVAESLDTGTPLLLARIEDGVAVLVLNCPARRNALGDDLTPYLRSTIHRIASDTRIRCVLLTGAGSAFCAGGNVKAMAGSADDAPAAPPPIASRTTWTGLSDGTAVSEGTRGQIIRQATLTGALHALPQPTIAALPGAAAGAGMSLALACDVRIAVDSAFITTAFRRVALPGDYGGTWLLQRLVGPAKAKQLYFTSEKVQARECARLGIVQELAPDVATLHARAFGMARDIASGPHFAMRAFKRNINDAADGITFRQGLENEAHRMTETLSNPKAAAHFREATLAFVEKRTPIFHEK